MVANCLKKQKRYERYLDFAGLTLWIRNLDMCIFIKVPFVCLTTQRIKKLNKYNIMLQ